jgi:hypothetical protein
MTQISGIGTAIKARSYKINGCVWFSLSSVYNLHQERKKQIKRETKNVGG